MANSPVLSIDEVKAIVGDSDIPFPRLKEMMADTYSVKLGNELNPEQFAEGSADRDSAIANLATTIFEGLKGISTKKAAESKENRAEKKTKRRAERAKKSSGPPTDPEGNELEIPDMTRTDFIAMQLKEAGAPGITSVELMKKVDEAYHYSAQNRSPRTRVLKTLRTLVDKNDIVKKETGEFVWVS